jgi:FHA domain-containing protein
MIPVNVTLQYIREGAKESKRLRLAMEETIGDTVNRLVRDLALPLDEDGQPLSYHLVRQRQALAPEDRLFEAGVQEGDILQLAILDPKATMGQAISAGLLNRLGGKTGGEPLPVRAALVASSGQRFELRHTRALIGRADSNLGYPADALDADLTELDPSRSVSRPHALIVFGNGQFTVRDLYSQRGLLLNGVRVSPSKSQFIQDGDVLTLGDVRVQFRCEN